MFLGQGPQRRVQLISRKPVALGAKDYERTFRRSQKFQKLAVTLLGRHTHIDQHQAQCQAGAFFQVRLDKLGHSWEISREILA